LGQDPTTNVDGVDVRVIPMKHTIFALFLVAFLVCCGAYPSASYVSCAGATCAEGSQCVEDQRSSGQLYTACAIGGTPDPKCGSDVDKTYCDGNTWIACKGHYRTRAEDCAERFCVEHGADAKCVPSREPDPRCQENTDGTDDKATFAFCEGNGLVQCIGPWARTPVECEASFCRGAIGEAQCRLESEPEPRCQGRAPGDTSFCDGSVAVWCDGDWRGFEDDCAKIGRRCQEILESGPGKIPFATCAPNE
jgi:hypothetical protein